MTELKNRTHTALLVVDVQNGAVADAFEREVVLANIGTLVERARREGVPVVWPQHSDAQLAKGSYWAIVPELAPNDGEALVDKSHGDPFANTALESVFAGLGVGRLVIVGAKTDACIHSTLQSAFARGYDIILVSDGHTTGDRTASGAPPPEQIIAATNVYWRNRAESDRTARVTETKNADLGLTPQRRRVER